MRARQTIKCVRGYPRFPLHSAPRWHDIPRKWQEFQSSGMVLPDRIELSTSPLPMECSTTELRQRAPNRGNRPIGPTGRADPCHKAQARARRAVRESVIARRASEIRYAPTAKPAAARRRPKPRSGASAPAIAAAAVPMRMVRRSGHAPIMRSRASNRSTMTDEKHKGEGQQPTAAKRPAGGKDSRQDRLKRALRENLRRRKSQARGRSEPAPASSQGGGVSPHDDGEKKPDQ